jgi:hypothetical protein
LLVREIARVLKPQGVLLLTVPWSARLHHLPHDYHRFTRARLEALFSGNGFAQIDIQERGSDIGAIANKLTVLTIRLVRPPLRGLNVLWRWPLALICGVLSGFFIAAALIADRLGMGSKHDPLGYFVRATREA